MAQLPEPPNSSQPFLPPPAAPGPRGLPRPTPIGALVGVVVLVLCLAALGLTTLLTNSRSAGRTVTPLPRTAVATRAAGVTGTPGAPTATRASRTGASGTPGTALPAAMPSAAVSPPLNQAAPPLQTVPAGIGGAANGAPTAAGLPPTAVGPAPTSPPSLAPAAVVPPTAPPATATPAPLTAAERIYLAAFKDQAVTWRNGMTAFNVEMQSADLSNPGWLQDVHITSGQILDLTNQVLKLQAPPRLAVIDARYKSAARSTAIAMQALLKWIDTRSPQVLQQFNSTMRQGSDDLQASVAAMAAFEADPARPPVLPPAAPTTAAVPHTPSPATPTSAPAPPPAQPPTKAAPPTNTPTAKPAPGLGPGQPVPTNTPGSSSQAATARPGRPA